VNWDVWRIVTHPRITCTLTEVYDQWSIEDLIEAHKVLDMLENATIE